MKRKHIFLLMAFLFSLGWQMNAQFTEGFEGATFPPANWTVINDGDANGWQASTTAHTGSGAAEINYSSTAHDDWLITPAINVTAGTSDRLAFYAKNRSSNFLEQFNVMLSTTGTAKADFTVTLEANVEPPTTYTQYVYDLSAYAGQTVYVAIQAISTDEWVLYIDDVVNDAIPACAEPTALSASNITTTQADLSWTAGGSENMWNIEYGPQGFTQGQGTTVSGVANPYTLTGLTPGTHYDYYVQADCGGGSTSSWVGPHSFMTLCSSVALPYNNNFDNNVDCWTSENTNGDGSAWSWGAFNNVSCSADSNDGVLYVPYDSNNDMDDWLFSPAFDLTAGVNYTLEFSYGNDGGTTYTENMDVFLSTGNNSTDGAAGTQLMSETGISGGCHSFSNTSITVATTGTYYIAFHGKSPADQDVLMIDDFAFLETPSCPAPSALSASNITDTQADLSWTENGSATTWNIELGAQGFAPTGNPTYSGVTNPYTVTGLNPETSYDYYVQADCGGGDASDWVGPYTFTTRHTPPVNDDCSNAISLPVGTSCNFQTFDNSGATDSSVDAPSCGGYQGSDVWFSFVAPDTGNVIVDTSQGDITDGAMAVYSGVCGNLTEMACDDDSSDNGLMPMLQLANLTPGETYFVRFWEYGGNTFGTFDICVSVDCSAPITPYYAQDFSSYLPNCWSESNDSPVAPTNSDDSGWKEAGWLHNGTTGAAAFNMYAGNDRDWLLTPYFDLSAGNYELSVDVAVTHWKNPTYETMGQDDEIILKYTDDGGATWNDLMNWNIDNQPDNNGRTEIISLANITGNNVQFAFFANEGSDERHSYIFYVDNFIIKQASCNAPTDLTVVNAANASAELSWTDNTNGSASYQVEWREALTSTWNTAAVPAGDTAYTITGLNSFTEYEWRLTYSCDGNLGFVVNGANFTVDCATITPDYLQDFSTYLPDCWRESNDSPNRPLNFNNSGWKDSGFANIGTTGAAAINMYAGNDRDWLISPKFDLTGGQYSLSVDVAVTHWQHPGPTTMGQDDTVSLKYSIDDGYTWNDLMVWDNDNQPSATGDNVVIDLANVYGPDVMFAFYADEGMDERHSYNFYVDNFHIYSSKSSRPNADNIIDANVKEIDAGLFRVHSINKTTISSIYVYDLTGRLIYQKEHLNTTSYKLPLNAKDNNVYIFNIGMKNDAKKVTKKVLLK